jgi:hypothetical protein
VAQVVDYQMREQLELRAVLHLPQQELQILDLVVAVAEVRVHLLSLDMVALVSSSCDISLQSNLHLLHQLMLTSMSE